MAGNQISSISDRRDQVPFEDRPRCRRAVGTDSDHMQSCLSTRGLIPVPSTIRKRMKEMRLISNPDVWEQDLQRSGKDEGDWEHNAAQLVQQMSHSSAAPAVSVAVGFAASTTWAGEGGGGEASHGVGKVILELEPIFYQLSYFIEMFLMFCISWKHLIRSPIDFEGKSGQDYCHLTKIFVQLTRRKYINQMLSKIWFSLVTRVNHNKNEKAWSTKYMWKVCMPWN